MGSLTLPRGATVYLDAQVLIYSVEKSPKYAAALTPFWTALSTGEVSAVTSELTILECLVAPIRTADRAMEASFEAVFSGGAVRAIPVDRPILRAAAAMRAGKSSIRTPDAIHAATYAASGADVMLTNDRGFLGVPNMNLVLLDEVLAAP